MNYLRLRASRRNAINAVIAFGGSLGTQSFKTIKPKYNDDRLCSGISEQPNNISEAVQWFKLFRPIVQSHRTFDAQGGIYSVNVFPS